MKKLLFLLAFFPSLGFSSGIYNPGAGGGGAGYSLEPATVTIQANLGVTASTVTVSTLTVSSQINFTSVGSFVIGGNTAMSISSGSTLTTNAGSTTTFKGIFLDSTSSAGTAGKVYTSNGAGQSPTWQAAAAGGGGGYSLEPATVTAQFNKGANSSTFTVIIGTYTAAYFSSTWTAILAQSTGTEKQSWQVGYSTECIGPETQFTASAQYKDFCSLTLDPGDWVLSAMFYFENGGGTNNSTAGGISVDSGNNFSDILGGYNYFEGPPPSAGVYQITATIPRLHKLLAARTTFYLKGYANYSSTAMYLRSSILATRQ